MTITPGPDRIFFAVEGFFRGCFILSRDALYNPEDREKPFSLLFDPASWKELIPPIPVKRFRGLRRLPDMPP